jgi:hypothetical protein
LYHPYILAALLIYINIYSYFPLYIDVRTLKMGSSASKAARVYPGAVGKTVERAKESFVRPTAANDNARLAEPRKSEGE